MKQKYITKNQTQNLVFNNIYIYRRTLLKKKKKETSRNQMYCVKQLDKVKKEKKRKEKKKLNGFLPEYKILTMKPPPYDYLV